jgi:hypothetical protein
MLTSCQFGSFSFGVYLDKAQNNSQIFFLLKSENGLYRQFINISSLLFQMEGYCQTEFQGILLIVYRFFIRTDIRYY